MKHLINLLKNGLFVTDDKLYSIFSFLSNYNNSNFTADDMDFLTNTTSGNISLYKLFTHIKNIDTSDYDLSLKIDDLIKQTLGEYELHQLKIQIGSIKLSTLDSLIKSILSIPINEFAVNMSAAPLNLNEKSTDINNQKLSLLLSSASDEPLFNTSPPLICTRDTKMISIDIYRGPPLYFDELTNTLSLSFDIPVTKVWQTKHTNPGYICQMIMVNTLSIIAKQSEENNNINNDLNNWSFSIQQLNGIKSIDVLEKYLEAIINAFMHSNKVDNNMNMITNDDDDNNNNDNHKIELSDDIIYQLRYLLLIKNVIKDLNDQERHSMKYIDQLILSKLRQELSECKINVQTNLSDDFALEINRNYNDNNNCYNLNRVTLKLILNSYNRFKDHQDLTEFQSIACPLLYKQCISIFPFYDGKNINIKSNSKGDPCTRTGETLLLISNPVYNPIDISRIALRKLQSLISFIQFDGNYKEFENIIRLIPFDMDDLPSILTVIYSMANIVYVTVSAAIYAFHLSVSNTFQVFNMYHLTCLLGPDAYRMRLHGNLNLPPLITHKIKNQLHSLPVNVLFPMNLDLYQVSFKSLENILDTIEEKNGNMKNYCRDILLNKNVPEYTVWSYLFLNEQVGLENTNNIEREYYLYKILQNIVENPYEVYYINSKLQSHYYELQQIKQNKNSINDNYNGNYNREITLFERADKVDGNNYKCVLDKELYDPAQNANYEIEQHDVSTIYAKLIAAGFDVKNDIGALFQYALQNKSGAEFVKFIKKYLTRHKELLHD